MAPAFFASAGAVRGHAHGENPRLVAQNLGERIIGELVGLGVEVDPAHDESEVVSQQQPWGDIGVMVHAGEHDLVTALQLLAKAA